MPQKDITRRESLKKLAVTAYAAPVTMMMLTSKRAVAQSCAPGCNYVSVNIFYNGNSPYQISIPICRDGVITNEPYILGPGANQTEAACGGYIQPGNNLVTANPANNDYTYP